MAASCLETKKTWDKTMSDFLDSFRWLWNGSQSFDHAIEFASFPVDQEAFSHTNCWEIKEVLTVSTQLLIFSSDFFPFFMFDI